MTTINRRNLIVLGGVSALVTACDRKPMGGYDDDHDDEHGNALGNGSNYGDDPSKPGPSKLSADYYSLVIIRINQDLKIESSYGSFDTPSKDDEAVVRAQVLKQLTGLAPGGDVQSLNPLADSAGYNFDHWGFASTRRVYVYVDNSTLTFEKNEPLTFKAVSSLRFTDPERAGSRKISKNKSFFGAKSNDKFARGSLLYFENYYLDNDGKPIPPKTADALYYAMNFHLNLESEKGGKPMPIIIDPDGGNGMNFPPPKPQ
jgi:hypothetical protein